MLLRNRIDMGPEATSRARNGRHYRFNISAGSTCSKQDDRASCLRLSADRRRRGGPPLLARDAPWRAAALA
jgi:hypothetical protein